MYLVYGLQKTGISIVKLFNKENIKFKIWDDNKEIREKLKKTFNSKFFFSPYKSNLHDFKRIYVSPGISLRQSKFQLIKSSTKLNRDVNLYLSKIKKEKIIAITGTNGKSTTTKLIGNILKKTNNKTFVGGNIGEPLCNAFISQNKYKYHVVELSSFQLETVKNIPSNISVITNLDNDHLDRYKDINDYIKQKKNIITNHGINLFSIDDKYSKKIFFDKKIKNKISFSTFDKSADIYMQENFILDNYFKNNKKLSVKKLSKDFEGSFNNQNILIAYICTKILKIPEKNFINAIKNFKGLPFRSSVIFKNRRLKIINNSKSTNINSTINSIQNYKNIFLVLGGIAKEKNFEKILNYKDKIICVYTFGKSSILINKILTKSIQVKKFKNLKLVIKEIFKDLKNNTNNNLNILFAPACTSYDQYKNFEERGKDFTKLIKENLSKL